MVRIEYVLKLIVIENFFKRFILRFFIEIKIYVFLKKKELLRFKSRGNRVVRNKFDIIKVRYFLSE